MIVVVKLVCRLGSRGIGDSESRKELVGFIQERGEGSGSLVMEGEGVSVGFRIIFSLHNG